VELTQYKVTVTLVNKSDNGKRIKEAQFYVSVRGSGIDLRHGRNLVPKDFKISNENLETSTTASIPKFLFEGRINSVNCCFTEPFDGYIMKKHCDLQIKSIEI
jgi:hypothetical protein